MLATILLVEVVEKDADGKGPSTPIHPDTTYAFLHQEIARFRGSEISWSQGRYTATFDGPSRAINCAKSIVESFSQRDTQVRAGLHTGECEIVGGKVGGIAVHTGARVMGQAEASQVVVSRTVRDLVAGTGLQFQSLGSRSLKGVSGEWELFLGL
jgi:class 3 adenylate cyclase